MRSIISILSRCFSYLAVAALILMMLTMVADIFLRFLFNLSVMGAYEIVELLMIIVVFYGFAHTKIVKGHVSVTMLIDRFPIRIRYFIESIGLLIAVVMTGLIAYGGIFQFMVKKEETTAVLFIPLYPFYLLLAIGAILYSLALFIDFMYSVKIVVTGDNQVYNGEERVATGK